MEEAHKLELRDSVLAFRRRARWLIGSSVLVLAAILALIVYSGFIVKGVITTSEGTLSAGASEELPIQREQLKLLEKVAAAYQAQWEIGQRSVNEYLYQLNRQFVAKERLIEIESQLAAAKSGVDITIDGRPYTAAHLANAYVNAASHLQVLEQLAAQIDRRVRMSVARQVDKFDVDIARNEAAVRTKRYEAALVRLGLEVPVLPPLAPPPAATATPASGSGPAAVGPSAGTLPPGPGAGSQPGSPESVGFVGGGVAPRPVGAGVVGDARTTRSGPGVVKTPGADEGNLRLVLYYVTQFSGVLVLLLTISILLPIYRYNVKLATFYQARADALGIFLITGREDFNELVRALTPNYSFDQSANTPVGALADAVKDAASVFKK